MKPSQTVYGVFDRSSGVHVAAAGLDFALAARDRSEVERAVQTFGAVSTRYIDVLLRAVNAEAYRDCDVEIEILRRVLQKMRSACEMELVQA